MPRERAGSAYVHGASVLRSGRKVPADDGASHWDIRVTLPDGSRSNPKCLPIGTSEELAREKARRLTQLAAKGGGVRADTLAGRAAKPKGGTVRDLAAAWLALVDANPDLAPSTKERHAISLNKWVVPQLGPHAPSELTTAHLRDWIRAHRAAGASPSSIRNAFFTLGRMIDDSAAEGWIDPETKNACRHPKVLEVLPVVAAPEEIVHFTEAAAADVIEAPTTPAERRMRDLIAALTGCREGELAGLRWENVSTEHGVPVLRIATALAKVGPDGTPARRAPKTRDSRRAIPVHPQLAPELASWRAQGWQTFVGRAPLDADPILPGADGKPWRGHAALHLQEDLEAAGLPVAYKGERFTMQAFRRSFATWLEAAGVPGDHIDRLLGHARGSVRGRHYSAADVAALARAVAQIRLPLRGSTPPPGSEENHEEGGSKRQRNVSEPKSNHGSARQAGAGPGLQNRADPALLQDCREKVDPAEASQTHVSARTLVADTASDASLTNRRDPRSALVADLARHVGELALVGDLTAARIASDALRALLGVEGEASAVVDLAAERAKRGGS